MGVEVAGPAGAESTVAHPAVARRATNRTVGLTVLALTDLHGATEIGPAVLATGLDFDVIALAGDLTRFFTPSQAKPAVAPFLETGRPVFAVAGNCDGLEVHGILEQLGCSVAGRGVLVDGTGFCGVPSAPPHHGQTWELDEAELAAWLELGHRDIAAAETKVLISHAPPAGTSIAGSGGAAAGGGAGGDRGLPVPGSTALRDGVLRYGFDLVICGHIHEARGVARLEDKVTVVNSGPARAGHYAAVDIRSDRIAVRLLTLGRPAGEVVTFPLVGRR